MINKIRYHLKHPRVLPGKLKRKVVRTIKNIFLKIKQLPSVTVIIPTYKPNDYIETAINSVLNQNYEKNKIHLLVIVNGQNEDYYEDLKEKYAKNKIVDIIYTEIPGVSNARSYGLSFVKTKYITYLDDDDYFTENYFQEYLSVSDSDVAIIISKMSDTSESQEMNDETYINNTIRSINPNDGVFYTDDYFKLSSLFSTICGKIYRTKYIKSLDITPDNLPHSEDLYFWVKNVSNLKVKMKIANGNSKESYIRRIVKDSRSRPKNEDDNINFYIYDRLNMIQLFEDELLDSKNDLLAKRFILNKIRSQNNLMLNHYNTLDLNLKEECLEKIKESKSIFLNKSLFGLHKGIAFCHNFPPFIDASAYVASKRLSKIDELAGNIINWDVIAADMANARSKDLYYDMFFANNQYTKIIRTEGKAYFSEKAQDLWGKKVYKMAEELGTDYEYIYSRSMWAGSHVAAYLYKQKHPEAIWYAEFSDPIYKGTDNEKRPTAITYTGDEEYLNNFWFDVEKYVFEKADKILFTNENQKKYMLSYHDEIADDILSKCIVLNHPVINSKYAHIIESDYSIDKNKINIAYFGSFYKNRNGEDLLKFLSNPDVILHLFTSNKDDIPSDERIKVNDLVSNLEFLNIASKMDYLYLNDVTFPGDINPYLPSKLADYISTNSQIIAVVNKGTELEKYSTKNIIKLYEVTEEFAKNLEKKNKYDLAIIDIPYYKELYTSLTLDYVKIADDILAGKVNLGFSILDNPQLYDENEIRWNFNEKIGNDNTFYLYYFGLRMVYILAKAYLINKNQEYLNVAKKIVKSFYNNMDKINNDMLYNDHAQSERIENVVFLYSILFLHGAIEDIGKICVAIINDALVKLLGDKYYQRNHNHGIIADKSCLIGLAFLKNMDEIIYVKKRLVEQIKYAFGIDGVHIENSVDYHYTVIQNLIFCLNILNYLEDPLDDETNGFINNIFDYMIYTYKPNGRRVLFGDSKGGYNAKIQMESYGNDKLKYVVTGGKEGIMPEKTYKYFDSGYAFMREHFNQKDFKDATWLSIKAGYKTRVHKHQDDLSICLYSKGQDIFVDPGMYNYVYRDPIKDYMESIPAHTTICIKDVPYSIANGNSDKFKIIGQNNSNEVAHVACVSTVYSDTMIYRDLYYYKDIDVVVIKDSVFSNNNHIYAQYFHLGENIIVDKNYNKDKVVLELENKNYHVTINQLEQIDDIRILKGLETEPYSLISAGFAKYAETETLEYCKNGKNVTFLTVVDIASKDCSVKHELNNGTLILEKNSIKHDLKLDKREFFSDDIKDVKVKYSKGKITVKNNKLGNKMHGIYVFVDESEEVIKTAYTKDETICVNCSYKNIVIMYYIKNRFNVAKHGILFTSKDGKNKQYDKLEYPKNINHEIEEKNGNYTFKVEMNFDFPCKYKWFVYYNGARIYYNENYDNYFDYKPDKPGEYVIIVSVNNKLFKEFDFYQYEKIVI